MSFIFPCEYCRYNIVNTLLDIILYCHLVILYWPLGVNVIFNLLHSVMLINNHSLYIHSWIKRLICMSVVFELKTKTVDTHTYTTTKETNKIISSEVNWLSHDWMLSIRYFLYKVTMVFKYSMYPIKTEV